MIMAGVNKVILVGRLGQDPEVKYTPSGVAVANFSIATSEEWKDKNTGEKKEDTQWHKIVIWRRLAEVAGEYLHKGSQVYIEGKLQTRSWEDKEGNKRYTTEIIVRDLIMLDSKGQAQDSGPAGTNPGDPAPDGSDDTIPF